MFDQIKNILQNYNGTWKNIGEVWAFSCTIAERKAFLLTKKLTYNARFKIYEPQKLIVFSEMLVETGSGLSSGSSDNGMSAGFGFKAESYNTVNGGREGNIEEQSTLFGKKFEYKFDYKEVRSKLEKLAADTGYGLRYQIMPVK